MATKQVTMMQANAGGVHSGLRHQSFPCLGALHPTYGTTFLLEGLKPGSTFTDVQLNFDTFCGKDNWVPLKGLSPGSRPPGPPYLGYELFGNVPNVFSKSFAAHDICSPNGCVTVGVIVGNGVSKSGSKPLCADTQYYPNFVCYPVIDPSFEIIEPRVAKGEFMKICRNNPIVARNKLDNVTRMEDLKNIRWELATSNASPFFSKNYSYIIDETYYDYKQLFNVNGKQYDPNKLYHFMVQRRGELNPYQVPYTNHWEEGSYVWNATDTIVTAEISAWDTLADISEVWNDMKEQIVRHGFDPFALTKKELAKMIWNGIGIPGQPHTGARGCIDTSGLGSRIKFSLVPRNGSSKKTLHFRDTSVMPIDTAYHPEEKKNVNAYTFRPKWNGYYVLSVSMTDKSGNCDNAIGKQLVAGFGMQISYDDSITCQKNGMSLYAGTNFRMFHPDPQNFGTWDTYKHWESDPWSGNPPKTPLTKWDWNKADDDTNDMRTIFGTDPWSATGTGNPYKQIGSSLYYRNDTGVYTWRVIAGDTSGCIDTMAFKAFITRLEVDFETTLDPGGAANITFKDKSEVLDPCSWALRNKDGQAVKCDSIRKWWINWGDGTPVFTHELPGKEIKDLNIQHAYSSGGVYKIEYVAETAEGCKDTVQKTVNIPGPQPAFKIENVPGQEITIDSGETVTFENLSDSFGATTLWNWSFGDGNFTQRTTKTNVAHTYTKPGRHMVLLEQRNYYKVSGGQDLWRSSVFPDTNQSSGFYVNVESKVKVKIIKKDRLIQIFPNPFSGVIHLKSKVPIEGNFRITIYNSKMQKIFTSNTYKETIYLPNLTPGLYFSEIVNGAQVMVEPLMAQ